MAKPSALDAKLAEINQQIATMEANLDKWKGMRDFLKTGIALINAADKSKRGRKPAKPGLPASGEIFQGADKQRKAAEYQPT